jgi:hypothetical protein
LAYTLKKKKEKKKKKKMMMMMVVVMIMTTTTGVRNYYVGWKGTVINRQNPPLKCASERRRVSIQ